MPVIRVSSKTIELRVRKLVRLRRLLLVLAPLCMGAAFWNIAIYADNHSDHAVNLISGGLALVASFGCMFVAAKLRMTLRDIERMRRITVHLGNGSHL
jgi:hypothetical protein